MPDELWNEVRDIVQATVIKTIPMEKKCKKAKWLSGEVLQIAVKRREVMSSVNLLEIHVAVILSPVLKPRKSIYSRTSNTSEIWLK